MKKTKATVTFLSLTTLSILFSGLLLSCSPKLTKEKPVYQEEKVILGNENFLQNFLHLVKDKRVGLVTNPSGVNSKLESTADIFAAHDQINLTALYGPEHGIRGAIYGGEKVADEIDPHTGLPVYSLYGKYRKPTEAMLDIVDVLIVDIQDIGSRSYTYVYTMAKVMEAAAEYNKEVIILDRPNPVNGVSVEGNILEEEYSSFVGMYPIAYRHGMTIGELAKLFNNEFGINCELSVIPLRNWKREMNWGDTGLPWVPTSPHIPHWETVFFYCTTGTFGELRLLSEGVGYTSPFELVGAPWINGYELAEALNALNPEGVIFRPIYYKPFYASYEGEICQGVQLHITDFGSFRLYTTGLHIMQTVMRLYPDKNIFARQDRIGMFNKVMGTDWIKNALQANIPVPEMEAKWQPELNQFLKTREKYLMY